MLLTNSCVKYKNSFLMRSHYFSNFMATFSFFVMGLIFTSDAIFLLYFPRFCMIVCVCIMIIVHSRTSYMVYIYYLLVFYVIKYSPLVFIILILQWNLR